MKRFEKTITGWKPLTILEKRSVLDVWHGDEYTSVIFCMNYRLEYVNKSLYISALIPYTEIILDNATKNIDLGDHWNFSESWIILLYS